jgi:hypothetical protein
LFNRGFTVQGNHTGNNGVIATYTTCTPPTIDCPSSFNTQVDIGECSKLLASFDVTTTGSPTPTVTYSISGQNITLPYEFPVGTTNVTATASGSCGSVSCTFDVTVVDNIPPTVITQPVTIYLDAAGEATVTAEAVNNASFDNCGIASMTLSQTSFVCSEVGANQETLTIVDVNGNSNSAAVVITVVDNIPPTVITQPVTIYLDAAGEATVTAEAVNNASFDNCGIASMTLSQTSFVCSEVGANQETLTIVDVNGNSNSAAVVITVVDNIPPTVITQPVTIYLDAAGEATVTAEAVNNASFDNCGIASMTLSQTSFVCSEVGANQETLTIVDVNGNSNSAAVVITVVDNIPPTVITQPVTIYLDAAGEATVTAEAVNNASFDNCGIASMTLSQTSFVCSEVGANQETLTIVDVNGNSNSAAVVITVVDNIPPTVITQPVTIYLDAAGEATVTAEAVNNASFDNCGIASMTLSQTSFVCSEVGANQETLTIVDVNGNSNSAAVVITVVDNIPPTVITQPVTIYLDAAGEATVTAEAVNNASFDNCGIASMTLSQTSFVCSEVGANQETLTIVDVNGNSNSAAVVITVVDNIPPTVITQPVTIYLDAAGEATVTAEAVNNASFDNCGIASMTLSQTSFVCSEVGANQETLTIVDINGNSNSAAVVITVVDNIPPTVITQPVTIYLDAAGEATVTAEAVNNASFDNCGIASMTLSQTSFVCSEVGANQETLTIVDVNGNSNSAAVVITVVDNIPPTVITQPVTIYLDAAGEATVTAEAVNNASFDNCGIASMTLSQTSFVCSEVGANQETLTIVDVNGNSNSAAVVITVVDNIPPTVITQPVTIYLDAAGEATVTAEAVNNASFDNCGIASMTLSQTSFVCSEVGANQETLTIVDVNGNSNSAAVVITVVDNIPPTVITQPVTIYLDAAGEATVTAEAVNNASFDNCGIASMTLSQTSFVCSEVGANQETLTIVDVNGNSNSAAVVITVVDNIPPTVITQPVTIYLDAAGEATVTAEAVNNASFDNCGIASMTLSQTSFDCSEVGANQETLTIFDVNGNSNSAAVVITVVDNIPPTVITQPVTIYLDAAGEATVTAEAVNNASFDNCGIASMTLSQTSFVCSEVGANQETLTIVDVNGNSNSAAVVITVVDNIPPTVITQPVTIYLDAAGEATVTAEAVNNASFDNCGIASMTLSQTSFVCSEVGANQETLTIVDVNGNSNSAAVVITVVDNIPPTVITQPVTIYLDAAGEATVTAEAVNNASFDNCGIASMTLSQTSFDCSEVGANTVTLTVTDVNGNISTADATVTVVDGVAPVVVTQNITIELGSNGAASITATQINNASYDNCGIASMSVSPSTFGCSNLGLNEVTLTVIDVNGNVATATATVTVENPITLDYTGTTIQTTAQGTTSANVQLAVVVDNLEGCTITPGCVTFKLFIGESQIPAYEFTGNTIYQIPYTNTYRITTVGSINIGAEPFIIYNVVVEAGCYFTGSSDPVLLTVYKPNGDMVTGGGYIIPHTSAGTYPANHGEKANYGFNVKNKPSGIQGDLNYKFDSDNRKFQVKATSFTSLGVVIYEDEDYKIAEFSAIVTLSAPQLGSLPAINITGLTLNVTLTDNGEPGFNDKIGFTLWNGTELMHSSWWMDYYTEELPIGGGNLVVHRGLMQVEEIIYDGSLIPQPASPLTVYPNPTRDKATFKFVPGVDSRATLQVYTADGVLVETLYDQNVVNGKAYEIEYRPAARNSAMFIYRLILNNEVYTGKLMFQK